MRLCNNSNLYIDMETFVDFISQLKEIDFSAVTDEELVNFFCRTREKSKSIDLQDGNSPEISAELNKYKYRISCEIKHRGKDAVDWVDVAKKNPEDAAALLLTIPIADFYQIMNDLDNTDNPEMKMLMKPLLDNCKWKMMANLNG